MKMTMLVLVLTSGLVATTRISAAADECAEDPRVSTELGQALGVLMYDSIVSDYAEFVDVGDIAMGLLHASDRRQHALSGSARVEVDADTESVNAMSVADARSIVSQWQPQTDQLDQQFIAEYKQRGQQQKSGILTHRLPLDASDETQLARCTANFLLTAEEDAMQVCYLQLGIDARSICDMEGKVKGDIARGNWTYGEFQPDSVIEGWVEAFALLRKAPLEKAEAAAGDRAGDGAMLGEVLEVVIPSDLAYGSKGMAGKVRPDETLWFVMAVK